MHKSKSVLFLGANNAARSQMAEAFVRQRGGERFEVYSAGLLPTEISPNTRRVMEEVGVSLEGQRSKDVTEYLGKLHFGYLITVCDYADQHCPTAFIGMGQRLHWSLEDPLKSQGTDEEKLAKFRQVRDQIDEYVRAWMADLG